MATNSIITASQITKESLRILHNTMGFIKGVNREYSSQFGQTGGKIGATINIRKPNRYVVQQGPAITPVGTSEGTVPLTLDRQWVVPMTFSSKELTLHIDEFSKRYIVPAMAKLASTIDLDCARGAITNYYADGTKLASGEGPVNFTVGTPGTTPGTSGGSASALLQYNAPAVYLNAGKILDFNAAPRDNARTCALDPSAQAMSVQALSGLFNPQGVIAEQYRSGLLGNALGFDFVMDQNMPVWTSGTGVSLGTIAFTNDTATCVAASATSVGVFKAGMTFTVAGYYMVNPENQQNTGVLQQFVIEEDVTAISTDIATLKYGPTIKLAGTGVADANTWTSTGAVLGAQTAVITSGPAGTPVDGTAYPVNIAYHKDAFTLGTCDLEIPEGVAFGARESYDGISMRVVRQYDAMTDFMVCRIDVLGGFAVLRPELAVRIAG